MSTKKSRTLPLLAAALIAFTIWCLWPDNTTREHTAGGDFSVLANRVWIDHMPTHERDKVQVFILFDEPELGGFSESSSFEGNWTSFAWRLEKGLVFSMLQAETEHRIQTKITRGSACAPFDYCLKLIGAPRGPSLYASMEDWIVTDRNAFDVRQTISELIE